MIIEQIYTSCLAQASYFIASDNEAIVIDPIREPEPYLEMAKKENVRIKYIFETHFHADFVSGHLDLAKKTGAKIIFGPNAKTKYESYNARDMELFYFGHLRVKTLHTPGHTLESTSYLLLDEEGLEKAVFTGDTLFIGEVGRPDLAVNSGLKSEDLAGMLFDSLQSKIKMLSDTTIIYPGHGAGSSCGKSIGKERFSTIAEQKKNNYALKIENRDEFIRTLCEDIPEAPAYFKVDAVLNQSGYTSFDNLLSKSLKAVDAKKFIELSKDAIVLDSRHPDQFEKGFYPNSINIGLNGQFAIWAAKLLKFNQDILLIADNEEEVKNTIIRLARVGINSVSGYLKSGISSLVALNIELEKIKSVNWEALDIKQSKVLDLREETERELGFVKNSISIPLSLLESKIQNLEKNQNYYIYCAGGYRSMIASSILKKNDFSNITNIYGGFSAIPKGNNSLLVTE
jgi:hydroxyacylglutathione hydrolase